MIKKNVLQKLRRDYLSPSLSLSYEEPLHIVKGVAQYLYDKDGKKYLDAINNIQHVGHCHPRIIEAAYVQSKKLNTNTRYLDEVIVNYAKAITAKLPKDLNICFFTNSGSESNDLALRLARNYTLNPETIVLDGAYHGHLISLIEISPYKYNSPGGNGCPDFVHAIPMPDSYRGKYRGSDTGVKYANELEKILNDIKSNVEKPATFIAESVMGCGGQIIPPKAFFKKAYQMIKNSGGICIADEVQIGFGRLGQNFWGFEFQNIKPDIITLGKSIGNGHPLSMVITNKKIADRFNNGMEYFNSFGGNPVSCAIGHEVLNVIKEERLQQNAHKVGTLLKKMLTELKHRHSIIGDVRGSGMFLGVELIKNKKTLDPEENKTHYVINQMKKKGILLSADGPDLNVIKIKPPLVFNENNATFLVETMDLILKKL
tara:strand:- start:3431 stop:4717 length:1287 start_codon:yes stop_codon:yes gene_type:complete